MKITAFKDKNLLILALSLGFLFFGWNAAEQHFASFYETQGIAHIAFRSLAILYATIVIGNTLGPSVASFFGLKKAILFGFSTYILLIFGITTKIPPLVFLLSANLGIGVALNIDLFEERIKEASAALGILGLLLGTVPSFLLNQLLPQNQIFILAILFSLLGGISLRVLEINFRPSSNTSLAHTPTPPVT